MLYYHGSPKLFKEFDVEKASKDLKVIHFSPHINYAKVFAVKQTGRGWLYTVNIKGQENLKYSPFMQNVCIKDLSIVKILKAELITEKDCTITTI